MLRRHRNTRFKKTEKVEITLIPTSVHIVAKWCNGSIIIERRYWARDSSGDITAYTIGDFDKATQKRINTELKHLHNLDFRLQNITTDKKIQELIKNLGYYYRKPRGKWRLLNQQTTAIQSPSHIIDEIGQTHLWWKQ